MASFINNGGIVTANYEADGDMKSPWPGVSEEGEVVRASKTLTGMIEVSAGDQDGFHGISDKLRSNDAKSGLTLFGPGVPYIPNISNGAQCTINSSGMGFDSNGEDCFVVSVTATGASTNWFELQYVVPAFASDTLTAELSISNPLYVDYVAAYMGTAGYATFANASKLFGSVGSGTDPFKNLGRLALTFVSSDWTKTGYANATNQQQWTALKLRIVVANGQTVQFKLRSLQVGVARKGRIAIVADDGYTSWLRSGVPVLEQYGLRSTAALIPSQVGGGGFATWNDWVNYVKRGNSCVAHGPLNNATNLFAAPYTTTAERVADMVASRKALEDHGLINRYDAKCYVWPQGVYASAAGEEDLLNAAQAAGFTLARSAVAGTLTPSTRIQHIRALSPLCHQRMTLPIIGHTYAGAIATADDAAETTNINNIITSIQALSTNGSDGIIMLHKVVARGATTAGVGAIEIEQDRLVTLAAAIQTEVRAGKLLDVALSDMA